MKEAALASTAEQSKLPSVISSKRLFDQAVVQMNIPGKASLLRAITPDEPFDFLRFPRNVIGGNVFIHVRSDKPSEYLGKALKARIEIWKKKYVDETTDLFIDLHPVESEPTHKLVIIPSEEIPYRYARVRGVVMFRVPAPKIGAIVLIPRQVP